MKRITATLIALTALGVGIATAQPRSLSLTEHFDAPRKGVKVEVPVGQRYTSAVVKVNGTEVASQVDSLPVVGRVVAFE